METNDLAMVSRIRVEVRGGSMEAAERTAHAVLAHAQMAGFMDGLMPQSGEYSDHHFHRPEVTKKYTEGEYSPDPWGELGLPYAGRIAFTFHPAVQAAGIPDRSFEVVEVRDFRPHGLEGHPGSETELIREDVTEQVIVLKRTRPVGEFDTGALGLTIGPEPEIATTDEILDNIRRLVNVTDLAVTLSQGWWQVLATLDTGSYARGKKPALRDAALECYGYCGQQITHYDARPTTGTLTEMTVQVSSGQGFGGTG